MIQDLELARAVASILQRSEKQQDLQNLVGTFVDVGILPQIDNLNNQVIYGRRGTGKTHILKVLDSRLRLNSKNVVIYIDARVLGSSNQFSDVSVPIKQRCLALFRDIFVEIHNTLLNHIVNQPPEEAESAFESLSQLSNVMLEPVARLNVETVVKRGLDKVTGQSSGEASLSSTGLSLGVGGGSENTAELEQTSSFRVQLEDKVIFPDLVHILKTILQKMGVDLYVLIDEWSSIPLDIQPYLSEFLRKGFLSSPHVILKIAALEYKSNFSVRMPSGSILGFELGADISTAGDIDDYYVYDRNAERITQAFSDMLFKHMSVGLPEKYLETKHKINSGSDMASKMFTNKNVFEELVRASEGVVRDLINIFNKAFFDAQRRGQIMVDKKAILEAARQWFEQDKENSLDDELRSVLKKIVREVIGHRKARSFLLARELEKNSVIQRLFDARVLHLMQRGYADKDNPGVRYNIYTLDYGTYVDLLNTSTQPQINLIAGDVDSKVGFIVPFDDKRSIRRIILTEDYLKAF